MSTRTPSRNRRLALLPVGLLLALGAADPASAAVSLKVNFQTAGATTPSGYTKDTGAKYTDAAGQGWVKASSLKSSPHLALDVTTNARDRATGQTDKRLDNFIHLQFAGTNGGVVTPAAWEVQVPNGAYDVSVGVGDASAQYDSVDAIEAEGVPLISAFKPSATQKYGFGSGTVAVRDGRLTLDALRGTNTKIDFVTITSSVAPAARPKVTTIAPADGALTVSTSAVVTAQVTQPTAGKGIDVTTLTTASARIVRVSDNTAVGITRTVEAGAIVLDPTAALAGGTQYRVELTSAVKDTAGGTLQPSTTTFTTAPSGTTDPPPVTGPTDLTVQNVDSYPSNTRMVFNRIGTNSAPPVDHVHDKGYLILGNSGTAPLHVTSLPIVGPWRLISPPPLPLTINPGETTVLGILFTASSGRTTTGSLTLNNDAGGAVKIDLAGFWQYESENGTEPKLREIVNDLYGFKTVITKSGQSLNKAGHIEAAGDEVLSPFWRQADSSQPSRVTQLAAEHTYGTTAPFGFAIKGGNVSSVTTLHADTEGQSLLPRSSFDPSGETTALFHPPAEFTLRLDQEWSNDSQNDMTADHQNGCTVDCGHRVRFWPLKTPAGVLVPNAYIASMDYHNVSGANYDYNDNVFIVSNIEPDLGAAKPVLYRIDAGAPTASFTDGAGKVWGPDGGFFTPSNGKNEGNTTSPIANTTDDKLFSTYRGNTGDVPIAQRTLDYDFDTHGATQVDVRLYFAERAQTSAGKRIFNVYANGQPRLVNLDLFDRSGGKDFAWSEALNGIDTSSGHLNLHFETVMDYPSIAAIEVFCAAGCG